jgi:hypothetical protein
MADKQFYLYVNPTGVSTIREIAFKDSACADLSAWKAKLQANPITVIYETTPTTETAQPYTNPQIVDPDGTEEYVTANSVPVGHDSTYSLVCPISGYDEVSANVTGINVWDEEWEVGGIGTDGTPTTNNDRIRSKNYVPIVLNTSYYFKAPSNNWRVFFYDADKNFIEYIGTYSGSRVITTPNNARYLKFWIVQTTYNNDIAINYPSTDHDYHAYQGQTYTADLGRTVYGGEVEQVGGSLTDKMAFVSMEGATQYSQSGDYTIYRKRGNPYSVNVSGGNALCNITDNFGNISMGLQDTKIQFPTSGSGYIYASVPNGFDIGTVTVCYELATPTTIQLTPQEIRTLLGTNNVWSNGSDTYIKYIADTRLFILKVTQ